MSYPRRELVLPPSRPPTTRWPLTPIDRFASQWLIQGTWVFDSHIDANSLKHGLSRLLEAYPILCGRVVAGQRIDWTTSGIPFIEETETALGVRDFGPTTVDVRRFGARYHPALIRYGLAPLLTVRLTQLQEGCVLALCASHTCLDGNGFYSMARNLSLATAGRPFTRPVFDRPAAPSTRRRRSAVARDARAFGWDRMSLPDLIGLALGRRGVHDRSFVAHFSPEALRRHKATVARESACERLSTNSALLGHVAHSLVRLLDLDVRSSVVLSAAVDQRGRVASAPEDLAGNAVSAVATAPIPAGASGADISARLHGRLAPLLGRPSMELEAMAALTHEVAAHGLPYSPLPGTPLFGRGPTLLYTNSFSKFPIYDLDFSGASRPIRPVRAIPHNLGDPIMMWPAPPRVGGVELYFSGRFARAVARLDRQDPWWTAIQLM